jgi:hypothetical protein
MCVSILVGCVAWPLVGAAVVGTVKQKSFDELTVALLCGEQKEAEDAAEELAKGADASRKWFEVFLLASRREGSGMPVISCCYAEDWGQRHRKELRYLEEDANSFVLDRNFLARVCLGLIKDLDRLSTPFLIPVQGKVFVIPGVDKADTSWDKFLLRGNEAVWLLSMKCKLQDRAQALSPADVEECVKKATGLPIIWYPNALRPTKKIRIPDRPQREVNSEVRVSELLGSLVLGGSYENSRSNVSTCLIVPTRRAIFLIGLPVAEQEKSAKSADTIQISP